VNFSAVDILRGVETVATAAGKSITGPAGVAVAAVGEGAGLAADIIVAMHDPVIVIAGFRSILPGYLAAKARVHDYVDSLANGTAK
jgi:hypothetical protein